MKIIPLLTVIYFLLFVKSINAQTNIPRFGDISKDEINLKECSFEKDAPAMYLINQQSVTYKEDDYSSKTIYQLRVRIKIFNERGFDYANIFIKDAKTRYTKVEDLEAFVYNLGPDGKIIAGAVNKDQIFKEKADTKKSTNIHFTFPNLKAGSVIEYRYTKIIKNPAGFDTWLLQNRIPVLISECTITTPLDINLNTHIVAPQLNDTNAIVTSSNTTNTELSKKFVLQKIPSFRIEPYMSSITDNLERIEFSVSRRSFFVDFLDNDRKWQLISSFLMLSPFFGNQIEKPIEGTEAKIDSIKKMTRDEKKVLAVYELVTKNVKWNEEQLFFAEDIENAWKTKSGSSAEINLLILNMLKAVGIECYPILISTRENGKIDMDFPNLSQFNGLDVLVNLKEKTYIIDGTEQYQSYLIPPFNTINRNAFLIDTKARWVNISDDKPYMNISTYIKADLDSTGMLKGDAQITMRDYAKAEELQEDKMDEKERKEESKNFSRYDDENIVIDSISKNDSANIAAPLVINIKFHYMLTSNDDFYFLNPFFFLMFRKNPFSDDKRFSDIDFGCMQHFLTYIVINVPENFNIEDSLKSVSLRTSDTSLSFRKDALVANDQIGIKYVFDINNPFFTKDNYPGVKQFFDKIYSFFEEQILLKKKPE